MNQPSDSCQVRGWDWGYQTGAPLGPESECSAPGEDQPLAPICYRLGGPVSGLQVPQPISSPQLASQRLGRKPISTSAAWQEACSEALPACAGCRSQLSSGCRQVKLFREREPGLGLEGHGRLVSWLQGAGTHRDTGSFESSCREPGLEGAGWAAKQIQGLAPVFTMKT